MFFNSELFLKEAEKLNITVSSAQTQLFDNFSELLVNKNSVMNLTAVSDSDGIAVRHFADSISVLSAVDIPSGARVIDIGTGGGFPGIPILIMRPDLDFTLLDSTAKKIDFVSDLLLKLGLTGRTVSGRAEELAKQASFRAQYDFCVSRAVASLNILAELCIPFLKTGGTFISMKGSKAEEEIDEAKSAFAALGCVIENIKKVDLSDGYERNLILIKKVKETDKKYPRQYGVILKRPL